MTPQDSEDSGERGATLLLMALMMVVFLGIASLAVDLGMAYAVKRQLSSTADAAALAGAQQAGRSFKTTGGCQLDGTPSASLRTAINTAVAETHTANAPWGAPATPPIPTVTCDSKQVTVSVTETSTLGTFFGKVLGVGTLNPGAAATARTDGSVIAGGLRPFTVCIDQMTLAGVSPYPTQQSLYARHNSAGGEGAAIDASWATTGTIDTSPANHGLADGDLVRIAITSGAGGASAGNYYVRTTPTNKTLTVSTTPFGGAQTVTSVGSIQVFKQTLGLAGGGPSTWEADDNVITTPANHGLAVNDYVRVWVQAGAAGATSPSDAYYVVGKGNRTLTVSKTFGGPALNVTSDGSGVWVYKADPSNAPQAGCNPTGAAGNWGYASFDLGGSQPVLKCLVEWGYNGASGCSGPGAFVGFPDGDPTETATGNSGNSIQSTGDFLTMLQKLVGQEISLPVAGKWSEQGSNAQYTAEGGVGVEFCGFAFIESSGDYVYHTGSTCWVDSLYTTAKGLGQLDKVSMLIQWKYVDDFTGTFTGTPPDADNTCFLNDATCIPIVRLIG